MAEDQGKEEEKFDFTPEGEAVGYISLAQARLLAMQTAGGTPGNYGRRYRDAPMVFEAVEAMEEEDYYNITLSFRPQGQFSGTPGQEQFFIEKEGTVAVRQVLSLPVAQGGRRFPLLPVAIGLVVVGVIAAVGAVFMLGGTGDDKPMVAVAAPTETPVSIEAPTVSSAPTAPAVRVTRAPTAPAVPVTRAPTAPAVPVTRAPTVPAAQVTRAPTAPATIQAYADAHAGGPGSIFVGDYNQLVGDAPGPGLGGFDDEVSLESLTQHKWIYESDYYNSLAAKAKLTNPTELVSEGETIKFQHACLNRTLLWCKLMEAYLVPNLLERTNGQVEMQISSFPELGLSGTDTMSLVSEGTLGASEIYGGYVGGEYPALEVQYLWGLWPTHEIHYNVLTSIFPDLEQVIVEATGAVVVSHNWIPGDDQFFFSDNKLTTLEDFKGLKTRSHSAALSDWIEGMGADAQFVAFAEVYTALERGILDAGVTGASPAYGQRWYEVTKYMNGRLISFNSTTNVINGDVWDNIPADLQAIIIEEGAKYELEALRIAGIQNLMGVARNVDAGLELVEFSEEIAAHSFNVAALQHVVPAWINRVGGADHPAVKIFNKKIGPLVGVRIEADGSVTNTNARVIVVPPTSRPTRTPRPTATPTPTPAPIFGREYIDGEIARIRDFTPNYIAQGDITQICADVNQSLSRVNVFGAALTLDVYLEQIASFYWNAEFRSYAVRIFQGLKSPEELSC